MAAQSPALSGVAGSSAQWQASESRPETAAKLPMAAVGKVFTLRVSSE